MRKIPVADYLIEFFIANGVTDVFGYQGGMVCHIFDSLGIYKDKINISSDIFNKIRSCISSIKFPFI